jgi:RNA polymerase sigma-70 factor (ECF subfamily)
MNSRVQRGRESEQIASILADDVQLYHQLVRPYERSIYMVSFSYMKNEEDADEEASSANMNGNRLGA